MKARSDRGTYGAFELVEAEAIHKGVAEYQEALDGSVKVIVGGDHPGVWFIVV